MKKLELKHAPIPICVPCYDFTPDEYQREKRTVIIAPIIMEQINDATIQLGWTCSRSRYCHDPDCFYSKKPKEDREEENFR